MRGPHGCSIRHTGIAQLSGYPIQGRRSSEDGDVSSKVLCPRLIGNHGDGWRAGHVLGLAKQSSLPRFDLQDAEQIRMGVGHGRRLVALRQPEAERREKAIDRDIFQHVRADFPIRGIRAGIVQHS